MKMNDWHIKAFDELESTNDTALAYSRQIKGERYVIEAKRQTKGRGRMGRSWQSLSGNLFFSLLFEFDITKAGELAIICSLSLQQSINKLNTDADVKLKWPNDVLLNGAKVSGILLEKAEGNYVIAGIGVNIEQSPQNSDMIYPTISLKEAGIKIESDDFLRLYLENFDNNVKQLEENGFENLRRQWIEKAKGIGEIIVVKQNNKEIRGIFTGIDDKACLLLKENKTLHKILAGDVFYEG